MDKHQRGGQGAGFGAQGIQIQNGVQRQQNGGVAKPLRDIVPQKQLFGVVDALLKILRTDTAPHNGDHRKAHRIADDAPRAVQIVCHGVGGDMHRAEQRDHRHDQHAPKLEQAVFKRRGYPDAQDIFGGGTLQMGDGVGRDLQNIVRARRQQQNDDGTHGAGNQRRHGNARHTHFQHEHAEGVAAKVDGVDKEGNLHRHGAVAGGAENGSARIVQRQKREGQRRDGKVQQRRLHHVVGNGAEQQPQHRGAGQQAEHRHAAAQQGA